MKAEWKLSSDSTVTSNLSLFILQLFFQLLLQMFLMLWYFKNTSSWILFLIICLKGRLAYCSPPFLNRQYHLGHIWYFCCILELIPFLGHPTTDFPLTLPHETETSVFSFLKHNEINYNLLDQNICFVYY